MLAAAGSRGQLRQEAADRKRHEGHKTVNWPERASDDEGDDGESSTTSGDGMDEDKGGMEGEQGEGPEEGGQGQGLAPPQDQGGMEPAPTLSQQPNEEEGERKLPAAVLVPALEDGEVDEDELPIGVLAVPEQLVVQDAHEALNNA